MASRRKTLEFSKLPLPSPSMGEGEGRGEEVRIETVLEVQCQQQNN